MKQYCWYTQDVLFVDLKQYCWYTQDVLFELNTIKPIHWTTTWKVGVDLNKKVQITTAYVINYIYTGLSLPHFMPVQTRTSISKPLGLGLWCLMPLSTIFQLRVYHDGELCHDLICVQWFEVRCGFVVLLNCLTTFFRILLINLNVYIIYMCIIIMCNIELINKICLY